MLENSYSQLPDDDALEYALSTIFSKKFQKVLIVSILERINNISSSSHPSEIVTCEDDSKKKYQLFLKYELKSFVDISKHKQDLFYEDSIYRYALSQMEISTPNYFGSYSFQGEELLLMVLDYIPGIIEFSKSTDPDSIYKATHWLADFHNQSNILYLNRDLTFIKKLDLDYFQYWSSTAKDIIEQSNFGKDYKWLLELIDIYDSECDQLLISDFVMIHGEFYPQNVMTKNDKFFPIDWQTAAIGPAEIDLAALTDNWPQNVKDKCIQEYLSFSGSTENYMQVKNKVKLARIYLGLLWLCTFPIILRQGNWVLEQLKNYRNQATI